jgi:hypothetical protein
MTHEQPIQPFDPFEEEVRRVLADEVPESAPERLVARVAAIPHAVRPGDAWTGRVRGRLGSGLAAGPAFGFSLRLAAVATVAAVAIVLVGGSFLLGRLAPPSDVGGSPSARVVVPLPSVGPVGGSPSAGAVVPPPSVGPSPLGPAGGPIPADFQPDSATFSSPDGGWLLGTATCAGAPCAAIVRTTDGGRTWASIPAPDTAFAADGTWGSGVSGLRFADAVDGWAFGPDLWATHDGGATWHRVSLPGLSKNGQVMALETAAGVVHAVYFDGNTSGLLTIATSPVGTDGWTVSPTTVELGAGPVPHPQLVLQGSAGWLVEVDRAVVAGARLVAGEWKPWQPPCLAVAGPATLAAASASDLVVACDEGLWATPTGVHVYVSSDGGATFTPAASKPPVFSIEGVAAPAPGIVFVAGSLSGVGSAIVGSFDGGTTWTSVHVLQGAGSLDVSFTTADQGISISTTGDGRSDLLMTRDGGRTWSKVPIAGG